MEAIFTTEVLDTETSSTSIQLDESSILRDIITDGFELTEATEVKAYTASGRYETENAEKITWGEKQPYAATISDPVIDSEGNTVTVDGTGFNYTSNYISPKHEGNKLIVTISNLKPTKDGIVYSNTSDSAIDSVNAADVETKEKEFPLPSVNLTSYTVALNVGEVKTDEQFDVKYQVLEDVNDGSANVINVTSELNNRNITIKNLTEGSGEVDYSDKNRAFPIKVILTKNGSPATDFDETISGVQFTDGVAAIPLRDQKEVTLSLPVGYDLQVIDDSNPPMYSIKYNIDDGTFGETAISSNTNNDHNIVVKHIHQEVTDTGISGNPFSSNTMIYILIGVIALSGGAGIAYVYRKKDEFIEE